MLLATFFGEAQERCKTVDEGFRITIPQDWARQDLHPIDSNAGSYVGETADLEFDEAFFLGGRPKRSNGAVKTLKKKERNPKLLKPGEEVWHVDGRIAHFYNGKVDPEIYGQRRFTNVASLYIPYEGTSGYLSVFILYQSAADLPIVRRALKSIEWKKSPTNP